jgi:hypothetical protein
MNLKNIPNKFGEVKMEKEESKNSETNIPYNNSIISASELTDILLDQLITNKKSFQVVGVSDIGKVVHKVEGRVERNGFSCRVYTEYRATALAGEMVAGGLGVLAAAGMAIHNLATYNPDYEIGKNKLNSSVSVTYKK